MAKNVLVSDRFGFIGTSLVEALVSDKGSHVHVVDDLSSAAVDVDYFPTKIGNSAILTFDLVSIKKFFAQTGVEASDQIYHLASPVGPAGMLQLASNMVCDVVRDTNLIMDYCTAHSLFSNLKRCALSGYHRLRPRNLLTYLDEFVFLLQPTKDIESRLRDIPRHLLRRKPLSNKMLI